MASAVDLPRGIRVETGNCGLEGLHSKHTWLGTDTSGPVFRACLWERLGTWKILWLGDDPKQGRFRYEDRRKDIKADPEKVMDVVMGGGSGTPPPIRTFFWASRGYKLIKLVRNY